MKNKNPGSIELICDDREETRVGIIFCVSRMMPRERMSSVFLDFGNEEILI